MFLIGLNLDLTIYFIAKFDGDPQTIVNVFKATCSFDTRKVGDIKPDVAAMDTLQSFMIEFLDSDEVIKNQKLNLSTYLPCFF